MEIKGVKLEKLEEIKEGTMQDGLPMPPHPEIIYFDVDIAGEDANVTVPNDPTNRHYQEVKAWYGKQKKKPFRFDFED